MRPKEKSTEAESSAPDLETEVDEAIRICGGDVRAALRATLFANSFLESEVGGSPKLHRRDLRVRKPRKLVRN